MTPGPIEPHLSLEPVLSFAWALIVGAGSTALFGWALWRFLHHRGRVLRSESIEKRSPELAAGPALLVGKVETDDAAPAVRVEIDQIGAETKNKNSWSHKWEERNRAVQVRPFRLRLPTDEVVSVLPDERIRIVDDLVTDKFEGVYRRRVAELTAGEKIWMSGLLAQEGQRAGASTAYRAGPAAWVLRGSSFEPLEVASGGLARQFAYWRGFYKWAAALICVVWIAVHAVAFGPYYVLFSTGKTETLQITRTRTYITRNKNTTTTHYVIHAMLPPKSGGPRELEDEVSWSLYEAARSGRLKEAPFVYSPPVPYFHQIGQHATLDGIRGFFALAATIAAAIIFAVLRRNAMPWYEQKRVVERGSGRLEESAWNIQVAGEKGLFVPGPKPKPPEPGAKLPGGGGFTKT
jgi:hypothetical protein